MKQPLSKISKPLLVLNVIKYTTVHDTHTAHIKKLSNGTNSNIFI